VGRGPGIRNVRYRTNMTLISASFEHSCHPAERIFLSVFISTEGILQHAPGYAFYIGNEFGIGSRS